MSFYSNQVFFHAIKLNDSGWSGFFFRIEKRHFFFLGKKQEK